LYPGAPALPALPEWTAAAERIGRPLASLPAVAVRVTASAEGASRNYFVAAAFALWACGFAAVAICWLVRWNRVRALATFAAPANIPTNTPSGVPVLSAPGLVEPGAFGIFRPVLLLPEGIWKQLDAPQLDAILAHELCHVRRHDNLTAAIHMAVQAIFWFHPQVWWLGARLVDERERACDEEVVRLGSQPRIYAAAILNVCRLYTQSPLKCLSGVSGSDLKARIDAILAGRVARELSIAQKAALVCAAIAGIALPVAIGMMNAPQLSAESPVNVTTRPALKLAPADIPQFRSASIRPCQSYGPAIRNGESTVFPDSPQGTLNSVCTPVIAFIRTAYVLYDQGQFNHQSSLPFGPWIDGGPIWLYSGANRYQIRAKAMGNPTPEMLRGPMLQAFLEARLKLKIHRETRQVPMYLLTVAKSGPRLRASQSGSCIPRDPATPWFLLPTPPLGRENCGVTHSGRSGQGTTGEAKDMTLVANGIDLDTFSREIPLGAPVINKTGIAGKFDFHLKYAGDDIAPGPLAAPSIATVLEEQLGLKLERTTGPREFVIIDGAEKPNQE
jgi:bla regulator protein BlaR1